MSEHVTVRQGDLEIMVNATMEHVLIKGVNGSLLKVWAESYLDQVEMLLRGFYPFVCKELQDDVQVALREIENEKARRQKVS